MSLFLQNKYYTPTSIYLSYLCMYRHFLLMVFLFTLLTGTVRSYAQPKLKHSTAIASFPFKVLDGGVIIVKAALDDHPDSLTFIFDTGNGGISLDSATVVKLGLTAQTSERVLRGIGTMKKVQYAYNHTLHLPGLATNQLDFHINDYELLTGANGMKIDGIIGYSLIKRYIIYIDYDNLVLEFYPPGRLRYPKGGLLLKRGIRGIPVIKASVADNTTHHADFYFDSGAGLCLLMSDQFEKDSSIFANNKKVILTQAEGIGKQKMKLTTVKKIKIGKYGFKKVPAHTFFDEYNVTNYPATGGLIGNDLLRRFNLILNYGDSAIHLQPNNHFADPFDYSYTGLSLYFQNGQVLVEEVMENSPAWKAGFKPGDIIVAINNDFSGNLQSYKNLLQVMSSRPKVIISRNGELQTLYVTIENILKIK